MVLTRSASRSRFDDAPYPPSSHKPWREEPEYEENLSREPSHLNLSSSGYFSQGAGRNQRVSGLTHSSLITRLAKDGSAPASEASSPEPSRRPSLSTTKAGCSQPSFPITLVCHKSVAPDRALRHITRGYRPDGSSCFFVALFQLHNQTFNIWSHIVGLPYVASFIWAWTASHQAEEPYLLALRLHAVVGLMVGAASATYHAGEASTSREKLLAIDQGCAFVSCAAHAMLITFFELSRSLPILTAIATSVLGAASVVGLYAFVSGWFNHKPKALVSAVMGLPNLVAFCAWATAAPTPTTHDLAKWCGIFAVTVAVWVLFLPERWLPDGALNYFGNSHNIMHVMVIVVFAHIQEIYGVRLAWAAGLASLSSNEGVAGVSMPSPDIGGGLALEDSAAAFG